MSCASCHNDGDDDGRTWDLTGMGEGLRNTVNLRGRAGAQGFLHWSGNFDEVQDFEGQIRALAGGTGSDERRRVQHRHARTTLGDAKAGVNADLDALAAYVASLSSFANSPHRNADGSLTAGGGGRPRSVPRRELRKLSRRRFASPSARPRTCRTSARSSPIAAIASAAR